ncbi:hypothetical protein L596_008863 [Steinernema carpocapsae]|uniref:RNA-directed RNA polymerase n=1 Tax=Steinernema carpocapsae TaxID=34508 RepID=A0A4U5PDW0_STECR|nr:hypothetical protein L596_008863 [Steinernema carpocapsae]
MLAAENDRPPTSDDSQMELKEGGTAVMDVKARDAPSKKAPRVFPESDDSDLVRIITEAERDRRMQLKLDKADFQKKVIHEMSADIAGCSASCKRVSEVPGNVNGVPKSAHFEVELTAPEWDRAFFPMVHNFLQISKDYAETKKANALMQVSNPTLLREDFEPTNKLLPLQSFAFGCMRSPFEFTNHHEFHSSESNAELLHDYFNHCREEPNHKEAMTIDFNHDLGDSFVKFASEEGNGYFVYMLKLIYNKVRRIIVNFERLDSTTSTVHGVKLFLLFNNPIEVRRSQKIKGRKGDSYWRFDTNGDRCLTWNNNEERQAIIADCLNLKLQFEKLEKNVLYNILSRLRRRCNVILEFSSVQEVPFKGHVDRPMFGDHAIARKLKEMDKYDVNYLIEALCSRGAVINDQFLESEKTRDDYVEMILEDYERNSFITIAALERILNIIDEHLEVRDIHLLYRTCFNEEAAHEKDLKETEERRKADGFLKVRKIVITPTRVLFVVPEMMMGNKFLREYDPDGLYSLRVAFRDDSGLKMNNSNVGSQLVEKTIRESFKGVMVAGKEFVWIGSSNSQMRDHGCYFLLNQTRDMRKILMEKTGEFDEKDPIKAQARFGQRFTQARAVPFDLSRDDYDFFDDIKGGEDENGERYTFSDGVGSISVHFARRIAEALKLQNFVPSVYQIRFRGIKGIVTLDPNLDYYRDHAKKYGIQERRKHHRFDLQIAFRKSQDKFNARVDVEIDIVKFSTPTPMQLNRPMINIMDQVTAMQSEASHRRMCARVHQLLDQQLSDLGKCLVDEHKAREKLFDIPRRVDVHLLTLEKGFHLTEEPFFRSLIQCHVHTTLNRLRAKNQVQIPFNKGRMMFGVIDESGGLQYGQIFCQVTNNLQLKTPGVTAAKTILTGPVLMTKNPQNVAGDMRMFNAVDIPELRHLVDVVVFPRYGPRPHPDQMAGSDLDGDEYAVIWDPELFFDRNEEPIEFPKPKKPVPPADADSTDLVINHIVNYIQQDSIGVISYAFLVNSDLYGIDSEVCKRIARKHSMAVDFPKTGVPPQKLTREPDEDNNVPPEKPDRYPDFMEKSGRDPDYVSAGLNGQIYRRSKEIQGILQFTVGHQESRAPEPDPDFLVEGWKTYELDAREAMDAYNASIRALLDNYGVKDEAELFTGNISNARNRLSDKDNDDMSLFNTNYAIEQRVSTIFQTHREQFFDKCGGYMELTVSDMTFIPTAPKINSRDLERRLCTEISPEMKKRASAYYQVCYTLQPKRESRRILSFPWIAYDVLAEIKKENYARKIRNQELRIDIGRPIMSRLDDYIKEYLKHPRFAAFAKALVFDKVCHRYATVYPALTELFFVLWQFGFEQKIFDGCILPENLFYLFLLFAVSTENPFLEKIPADANVKAMEKRDLHARIGGMGGPLMDFLEYLCTREFQSQLFVSFNEIGVDDCLQGATLASLSRAAIHTYYRITFSGMFFALPQLGADHSKNPSTKEQKFDTSGVRVYEIDPFVIEVPSFAKEEGKLDELTQMLKLRTGMQHLVVRIKFIVRKTGNLRLLVSGIGSLEAIEALRDVVSIKPNLRSGSATVVAKAHLMADMVYAKIMGSDNFGGGPFGYCHDISDIKKATPRKKPIRKDLRN